MYYSTIGLLSILIISFENHDILFKRSKDIQLPVWRAYRGFLFAVLVYSVVDALWGLLEYEKLATLLFIDTQIYFISMAVGLLLWTKYAVTYLDEKSVFGKFLIYSGRILSAAVILAVGLNFFFPVLFSVDEKSVYRAYPTRYALLISQIVLLLLISAYAFAVTVRRKNVSGNRYRTIATFGLIMGLFLTAQLWFPYLPLYAVAYLLGTCILRTFVVNDEKEEYQHRLEEALKREKRHYEELKSTRALAYKDALTGVKSKQAYMKMVEEKDAEISEKSISEFAVVVFDLNELKIVNDELGHEKGDQLIINACQLICNHYKHSPIFRIGGDEFVAVLERSDYQKRYELQKSFDLLMEKSEGRDQVIISMGMSDYVPDRDELFNDVFVRADRQMYERKHHLKKLNQRRSD